MARCTGSSTGRSRFPRQARQGQRIGDRSSGEGTGGRLASRDVCAWLRRGGRASARRCSPAFVVPRVNDLLGQGWEVVASDYLNLNVFAAGSKALHPLEMASEAARNAIDIVRGARHLAVAKAGTKYLVWGCVRRRRHCAVRLQHRRQVRAQAHPPGSRRQRGAIPGRAFEHHPQVRAGRSPSLSSRGSTAPTATRFSR